MKKKMALFVILGGVVIAAGVVAYAYTFLFRQPNPPLAPGTVRIGNATFNVELATSSVAQARGLSYRAGLAENASMFFILAYPGIQNFWMKDMNFPIDIIWIGPAANGVEQVLGFAQNAAPQPGVPLWNLQIYSSPGGTDKVLEVNAGTVAKDNIHIGDAVQIGGAAGI